MASLLVVGGAGYVGSATVAWLLHRGHRVTVLDDLSTGHREFIDALQEPGVDLEFFLGRAGDRALVEKILQSRQVECVMHFAARSLVAESFAKREEYFENNVNQTRMLVDTMLRSKVRLFVFSSTCAIFGDPGDREITEDLPQNPINPYGETKLEVEQFLQGEARARGLHSIALRYFNAAGAEPRARIGEWHEPESHLIPRVLNAAQTGQTVSVFGDDYPTRDGTCVRDYVHVWDLAAAHGAALERLQKSYDPEVQEGHCEGINLGSESGFTVREVIAAAERVVGRKIDARNEPRRPGDPARLVANAMKAKRLLHFEPEFTSIDAIVESAWHWELRRQDRLKPALFLDRDGTLNVDPGYIKDPADLQMLPGVGPALKKIQDQGFQLVVVTNQSGVGRGWITPEQLDRVHARLRENLEHDGVVLSAIASCLHRPDEFCECRKPKPQLIWDQARKLGIDLARSYMVGDRVLDLQAGLNAGCAGVFLVRTGSGRETEFELTDRQGVQVVDDLEAVSQALKDRTHSKLLRS